MKKPMMIYLSLSALFLLFGCVSMQKTVPTSPLERQTVLPTPTVPASGCLASQLVGGKVVDEEGRPIASAVVRLQATSQAVITDSEGKFLLCGNPKEESFELTAYADGYYINNAKASSGASDIVIALKAHTTVDHPDYEFLTAGTIANDGGDSTGCAQCHSADASDLAKGVTLPYDQWLLDAHAQSAKNPRFLSMYNGTDLQGHKSPLTTYITQKDYGSIPVRPVVDSTYFGPGFKLDFPNSTGNCASCHQPTAAINAPYDTDPNTVSGVGLEGVTCDFCHKVADIKLDSVTGLPAKNMPGVLSMEFLRPSSDEQLFIGPFDDVAPGNDTYSALQNSSQICAACHSADFWDTKIYNSYGEWLASPYSNPESSQYKTCQDCHMPTLDIDHFARTENGGLTRDPDTIFSHKMLGASDVTFLQDTAELKMTAQRKGNSITVSVSVYNAKAGHDMPTDSPLRQILLAVKATDENGKEVPLKSGPVLPDWTGNYANTPGIYFAKILEELWTEETPTASYWMQTRLVEDTRLPAFQTRTAEFVFEAPADSTVTLDASLIYRRAYYSLMQEKGWNVPDITMNHQEIELQ